MITVTYEAGGYDPRDVSARYVRFDGDGFFWCEVGPGALDVRQGRCEQTDLTDTIAEAARARHGRFPSYVEWPL